MDLADLYDHEVAQIGPVWQSLMNDFSRKANTKENLAELAKRAHDAFLRIGLVIEMNTAPCLIVDPKTMQSGAPEIVIIGRVPGRDYTEDGVPFTDHELKRHEILLANERGEKFLGQKG